jgi:ABC-type transport system substrate-binding protein
MVARVSPRRFSRVAFSLAALFLAGLACAPPGPPRTMLAWLVGQEEPRFDPSGPPDPVRWALERLLGEGLVAEDTSGHIVAAAAQRWDVTPNGLTYTFLLRPGLRFGDGRPCTSAEFRRALCAGLNRVDHATYAWLLSPIVGVERVRAGRPLPALGIATPDERTIVLRLARADPTMLHKLAIPGASMPWAADPAGGGWGGGIGPYHLISREPGRRMVLTRRSPGGGPDTVRVEFASGATRARDQLRRGWPDLVWPVPPGLLAQRLPGDYQTHARAALPTRRLWLVMRADLPPTRKVEARRALAHSLNRGALLAALGQRGSEMGEWVSGGGAFDFPRRDAGLVREWLDRGKLGRSLHAVMAYAADGVGAEVARAMQNEWAELGLDVELRPLRGAALAAEALGRGGAQLLLLEAQAPLADPVAELSILVAPRRGPSVGSFRTGWSTGEFDRWIGPQPPATTLDIDLAQRRLGEDLVALPLLRMPWLWVERAASVQTGLHPHFGPDPGGRSGAVAPPHQSN